MPDEVPDIYCDGVVTAVTPYDVILQLQRRPKENPSGATQLPDLVGCVRLSLEQAKVLCIVLKASLKALEDSQGTAIPLHPQVRQPLGISKNEDW